MLNCIDSDYERLQVKFPKVEFQAIIWLTAQWLGKTIGKLLQKQGISRELNTLSNNKKMLFFRLILLLALKAHLCFGGDTIFPGQYISGNQRLSSQGGVFELGFFTPGNSKNHYLGIWYKGQPKQTVVWVANRDHPVPDPFSSELRFSVDGNNLVLLNSSKMETWSTNVKSNRMHNSTVAMLLDNGNFVLCERSNPSILMWQSFDYPTDTWLPGMKLGFNISFHSWKFSEDTAQGNYVATLGRYKDDMYLKMLDTEKDRQFLVLIKKQLYNILNFSFVWEIEPWESWIVYYSALTPNTLARFVLDLSGQLQLFGWRNSSQKWALLWENPGLGGTFSACNPQSVPTCVCLKGFKPNTSKTGDQAQGCIRRIPLGCESGREDKFIIFMSIRPVLYATETEANSSIHNIVVACSRNCSCIAYAYDELQAACWIWKEYLPPLEQLPLDGTDVTQISIHVRVAASEVTKTKKKGTWIATSIVIGAAFMIFTLTCVAFRKKKQTKRFRELQAVGGSLVLFKYQELNIATKKFSEKLGGGGFGLVFRGKLPNSTAIAVKQLTGSRECEKQFLAEVRTLEKVQHINLVRLQGFCVEGSKRFLVYDYTPNGSLASLLFQNREDILNWRTIYHIAVGTARGIAYLHEKCIDCIIHCDIKPENVLVDAEYNPKVADFGLAKLLGRDFSRVLTTMRGTRGYLAPEWMSGLPISSKADVYSYGKLLFEMLSRKRNMDALAGNSMSNYFPYQVANALNKGEDILTLLNYSSEDIDIEELIKACKVASWCIQDDEKDRPSMGEVVNMLEGLIEVGTPPIPRYFRCLAEDPVKILPGNFNFF